jgi:hypothetical protein
MPELRILWQRLVDDAGNTCERCSNTQLELHRAVEKLRQVLSPLGLEPILEDKILDAHKFVSDPSQSNRVWINGKALEEWIGGEVGMSPCCTTVCEDAECRTVEVGNDVFEVIPEELIIKAALLAAAELVSPTTRPCCDPAPVIASDITASDITDCCVPQRYK